MGRLIGLIVTSVLLAGTGAWAQGDPLLSRAATTAGVGFVAEHRWGLVGAEVTNPSATPAEPLLALRFDDAPTLWFGREVWLPPRSQRTILLPVRPTRPARMSQGRAFAASAQLIDVSGDVERPITRPEPSLLMAIPDQLTTGILSNPRDVAPNQVIATLRESLNMTPTTLSMRAENAPSMAEAWSALDVLVVAAPELELDAAQLAAMRQWLYAGGRVWIMLDQADAALPERLLGDHWRVARLGRVGLTELTIEPTDEDAKPTRVTSDYPLQLERVAAEGFEVLATIDGYPAAMRRSVGEGEVLVTLLEPRAWAGGGGQQATTALSELSWLLRSERDRAIVPAASQPLAPLVKAKIGYRILERHTVILVLGGFTAALLFVGVYLSRLGRMEYAAVTGAVMAVITTAVLVGLGLGRQLEYPTLAAVQVMRFDARLPVAHAQGVAGVYQPQGRALGDAMLRGSEGTLAWPDMQAQGGGTVRLVFTDPLSWRYEQLQVPAGAVLSMQTAVQRQVLDRPTVRLGYTPRGLEGQYHGGAIGELSDALILGGGGAMAVQIGADGAVRGGLDGVLPPGQYVTGGLLSQEQMLRQEAYRHLLADARFVREPSLVGWSTQAPLSVSFREDAVRQVESLLVVPLELERPAAGEAVAVPAALMPIDRYTGGGKSGGTIFDPMKQQWIGDIGTPQRVYLAFDLPTGVEDLTVTGGEVLLDMNAAGWTVQLLSVDERNDDVVLAERQSPLGVTRFDLADNPPRNVGGRVVLGLYVQPTAGATGSTNWTINRLSLSVRGQVPGRANTPE